MLSRLITEPNLERQVAAARNLFRRRTLISHGLAAAKFARCEMPYVA